MRLNPRALLLAAAGLDLAGQLLVLAVVVANSELLALPPVEKVVVLPIGWLFFCLILYVALGWLFGSYTVLRWQHLPYRTLIQRVALTAVVSLFVVAVFRWFFNADETIWLLHRRVQLFWLCGSILWSFCVRIALRRDTTWPDQHRLFLIASDAEADVICKAWIRVPQRQSLLRVNLSSLLSLLSESNNTSLVTIAPNRQTYDIDSQLINQLSASDPRRIQIISPVALFEKHQDRLPPLLLSNGWMSYSELPWAEKFSLQTQAKRFADLFLASVLLVITSPLLLLSIGLIWLDDGGPVFFQQKRTGWMGKTFKVLKLRTMYVQPQDSAASWTQERDHRITKAGSILRKTRIDELPQLINVLQGDMSLIGPRPERPELEQDLENNIPFYRMRYWMRPGLSGWAQVCAPYASSIEDTDLKLSYDLFYLKNFSIWLDLIILFRTIKTILKASGR